MKVKTITREEAKIFMFSCKRYEIYAWNENESGIAIIETAHSEEEKIDLIENAKKQKFDFIDFIEY